MLSVIEDVQEVTVSTKDDLVNVCYLLEELGQDEEQLDETQMLAEILYAELVKRSHELDSEEV